MKKSDLKTGMLVQYRNGKVCLVINNTITDLKCYSFMSDFTIYLLSNSEYSELDIVKVSNVIKGEKLNPQYWTEETLNNNLLWERKECTELTIEEIEKLTGLTNIKIVKK